MTTAIGAFGTKLQIGDGGGPETFTEIAEVTGIGGPGLSADTIDVSSMSSTGAFREFIAGLRDGGEISLDINFVPTEATHAGAPGGLLADYVAGTVRNFKVVWPEATEWSMAAIVTAFEPNAQVDDKLSASVTLKITGKPTIA